MDVKTAILATQPTSYWPLDDVAEKCSRLALISVLSARGHDDHGSGHCA